MNPCKSGVSKSTSFWPLSQPTHRRQIMTKTLAEALREAVTAMAHYADEDRAEFSYPVLDDALVTARAALAAYDAKRESALQELADLGQAWDAT
jgi:hypothetical protein